MKVHPLLWMLGLIVFLCVVVWRVIWVIRFVFPSMIPLTLLFLLGYWIYSLCQNRKKKDKN